MVVPRLGRFEPALHPGSHRTERIFRGRRILPGGRPQDPRGRVGRPRRQGRPGGRSGGAHTLSRSIAGTQLGVTLSSIGLGFVGEPALAALLDPPFHWLLGGWHTVAAHTVAAALAFLLITFLHVVFGELIPKALALQNPDGASLWLARPLIAFARLTRPLLLLMNGISTFILRCLGYRPVSGEEAAHSIDELMLLIEDTEEAGVLDADQADFVQNVFRLSDKRVRDCMVPREKMAALELNSSSEKVLEAVRTGAHTRMPVYEGAADNIVGIVNTKDLFYLFSLQGVVVLAGRALPGSVPEARRGAGQRTAAVPQGAAADGAGARRRRPYSGADYAGRRAGRDRRRHRGRTRPADGQAAAADEGDAEQIGAGGRQAALVAAPSVGLSAAIDAVRQGRVTIAFFFFWQCLRLSYGTYRTHQSHRTNGDAACSVEILASRRVHPGGPFRQ